MKRNYIVDTAFYFELLLFYSENLKVDEKNVTNIMKQKNSKTIKELISPDKINTLVKCTGAALFDRNLTKYFANTNDFYQLLNPYFIILKSTKSNPHIILHNNLKEYQKENKLFFFEKNAESFNTKVRMEQKHIQYYLIHQSKNKVLSKKND